jgi:hypothetical protein
MFQNDQTRAHMATATRKLLEEYNINFIESPPADLSLIQLCFGEIQRWAKEHYSNIKTKDEIWDYVKDIVFKKDFKVFVQKYYGIVPDRWNQVFENQKRCDWYLNCKFKLKIDNLEISCEFHSW